MFNFLIIASSVLLFQGPVEKAFSNGKAATNALELISQTGSSVERWDDIQASIRIISSSTGRTPEGIRIKGDLIEVNGRFFPGFIQLGAPLKLLTGLLVHEQAADFHQRRLMERGLSETELTEFMETAASVPDREVIFSEVMTPAFAKLEKLDNKALETISDAEILDAYNYWNEKERLAEANWCNPLLESLSPLGRRIIVSYMEEMGMFKAVTTTYRIPSAQTVKAYRQKRSQN